jgi:hypothetical protein
MKIVQKDFSEEINKMEEYIIVNKMQMMIIRINFMGNKNRRK